MDEATLWRDEVQTQLTSVQVSLKEISKTLLAMNGKVSRHEEEIFGNADRDTPGLVPDVREIKTVLNNTKIILRTVQTVTILLGVTNLGAVLVFIKSLSDQLIIP
jgi:hypothetical protein